MGRALKSNIPIKLGLIQVPVSVHSALESSSSLSMVCSDGHATTKIKSSMACPECGNKDRGSFGRASQVGGDLVEISQEALDEASAPDAVKQSITLTVHPADDLGETLPGGKAYFLKADKSSLAEYALLVQAVSQHRDLAFLTRFAIRTKEALYRLTTHAGALSIVELAWPESINEAPTCDADPIEGGLAMLEPMLKMATTAFDIDQYRDRHQEVLTAALHDGITEGVPRGLQLVEAMQREFGEVA